MHHLNRVAICSFALLPLGCAAREAQRLATDARPPTPGVTLAYPCQPGRLSPYDAVLPIGFKASEVVAELGKLRAAPEAKKSASGASKTPRVLSLSFEPAGNQVAYQEDCGPPRVNAPVLVTARLSDADPWQANARLQINQDRSATLRVEDERAPFQLNARVTALALDAELTMPGAIAPTRFSTLCETEVATTVASSLGVELPKLVAPEEIRSFSCMKPNGTRVTIAAPASLKLLEHDAFACAPQAGAPATFELALGITAPWAEAPLRGQASLVRDGSALALHFRAHGKARATQQLATILSCAAADTNISVAFEGGARGPAPARRDPYKLTYTFSCEDVQIQCTAE